MHVAAQVDEYDRTHMDVASEDAKGSSASELEKTSLREAVEVFNRTFMADLWGTIRCDSWIAFSSLRVFTFSAFISQERIQEQNGSKERRKFRLLSASYSLLTVFLRSAHI